MRKIFFLICLTLASCSSKSWRESSRQSMGIAPSPASLNQDIVQIYYARAYSWKGYFGVHPWISWKKRNEKMYTVAQVTGWQLKYLNTSISVKKDIPDRRWFGSDAELLFEARGEKASRIISQMNPIIKSYPFKDQYRVWPGPNSNTFISYLIRNIPELGIELPPTAVGKDYLGPANFLSKTASGTGFSFSAFGLLGLTLGIAEGIELNLLGLHFGLDFWSPAIKLPIAGRIGFKDKSL